LNSNINFPLISILVNCFNSETYIEECLNSLINQTYKNIEICIWDNNSNDKTYDIIKKFLYDSRVKYFKSTNHQNLVNARIEAWKILNGEFVAILDSDDISFPNRLAEQIKIFLNNNDIAVVGSSVVYINEDSLIFKLNKLPIQFKDIHNSLGYKFVFNNSTLMFRKKFVDIIGGYNNNYIYINDYELVYRLSRRYLVVNHDNVLSKNRIHSKNLSIYKFIDMQKELINFLSVIGKENQYFKIKLLNRFEIIKCHLRLLKLKIYKINE